MNAGSAKKRAISACVDLSIDDESTDVPDLKESKPVASNRAVLLNQSSSSVEFRVFGTPEVLERHRVSKHKYCYNPSKAKQAYFLAQCEVFFSAGSFKGPVAVSLTFYFKRPLYHYGSGRNCNVSENREIVRAKNRLICITEFHDLKYAILLLAGRLEVYAYLRAYHKIVKFLDKFHHSNSLR